MTRKLRPFLMAFLVLNPALWPTSVLKGEEIAALGTDGTTSVIPLADALNTPDWQWTSGGDVPWFGQAEVSRDGEAAAQSGATTDNQESWMETTVTGPGTVTFWWKVSSEFDYDFLEFFINGVLRDEISGTVDWQETTFDLDDGENVLRWSYVQDSEISEGENRGWVDQVNVTPPGYPAISAHPQSQVADPGGPVTFTVTAAGTEPFSYQWQKEGVVVEGARSSTYTIDAVQPSDSGFYSVTVSNHLGSVTSSAAQLRVTLPLAEALNTPGWQWTSGGNAPWSGQREISHDGEAAAQSGSIHHHQDSWLETTVTGPGSLSFWWKVSSEADYDFLDFSINRESRGKISGTVDWQEKTFDLADGEHVLRWRYAKDSSASEGEDRGWVDQVTFTPSGDPGISTQPHSQFVDIEGTVTFTVIAAGTGPFSYQWKKDGVVIEGATSSTYTIEAVQASDAGLYAATVTNPLGSVTSSAAQLRVTLPLAEALNTPGWQWTSGGHAPWSGQREVSHDGEAAAESGATTASSESWMETTVTGPGTITFWWKVSSRIDFDLLKFSVNGESLDIISGSVDWQEKTFDLTDGEHVLHWHYVQTGGISEGENRGWVDQVTFNPPGYPRISTQPQNQVTDPGGTVTFAVTAAGTGPFSYQWQKDGVVIEGATSSTYTIDAVQASDAGLYAATVTNDLGSVTSSAAQLRVTLPLAEALNTPDWQWRSGGDVSWSGQAEVSHDGEAAAQSGATTDNQESWMEATVTGPGTITFWWKVSSEFDYDFLEFFINGALLDEISGTVDWQEKTFNVTDGEHVLRWRYVKDGSGSEGENRGWVDQVSFTGGGPSSEGYTGWAVALPEGERGESDDPGGRGIVNFLRYSFGMDALDPDRRSLPHIAQREVMVDGEPQTRLSISFTRRKDDPGLIYSVEASDDLLTWAPLAAPEEVKDDGNGETETVTLTDPELMPGKASRFLRVRVQR